MGAKESNVLTDGKMTLLLTCEHGGNRLPRRYAPLFAGHEELLASHRGWDPGALALARKLARHFGTPLVYSTTSRLLVELNRSPDNPELFSAITSGLDGAEKARILNRYYWPYRRKVERLIRERITAGQIVVHVSVHSFTPVLDGKVRRADVGLLFDPKRGLESRICDEWERVLQRNSGLVVRKNYPYKGTDDGLTTHLRNVFGDATYAGIEIEMNQRFFSQNPAKDQRSLAATIVESLACALAQNPAQ